MKGGGVIGAFAELVANIGFPIGLSIFFIAKLDKSIENLQESIDMLLEIMKQKGE